MKDILKENLSITEPAVFVQANMQATLDSEVDYKTFFPNDIFSCDFFS